MVVLVLASPILPSKNNFVKALRKKHPNITTVAVSYTHLNVALQEDNLEKWVPQVNGKVISYDCFYIGEDTFRHLRASNPYRH